VWGKTAKSIVFLEKFFDFGFESCKQIIFNIINNFFDVTVKN